MTSIEWLVKEIKKHDKDFSSFYGAEITQAKEMHRKEVTTAFIDGEFNIDSDGCQVDRYGAYNYYEETFKK
jgi:hypothetical protein